MLQCNLPHKPKTHIMTQKIIIITDTLAIHHLVNGSAGELQVIPDTDIIAFMDDNYDYQVLKSGTYDEMCALYDSIYD